jgi:glutathione peroxidase
MKPLQTSPIRPCRGDRCAVSAPSASPMAGLNARRSALAALGLFGLLGPGAASTAWGTTPAAGSAAAAACPPLLQQRFLRLQDERPIDLCQYAGRVVLVVNTASKCGYTPQYESLQTLYQRYAERGLVVLGFPSADFGGQELASNAAIAEFCENTFAVRFPMFTKTTVKPGAAPVNPLFETLAQRTGQRPRWNFHKYLIARDGQQVLSIGSDTDPLAPAFIRDVDRLLAAR